MPAAHTRDPAWPALITRVPNHVQPKLLAAHPCACNNRPVSLPLTACPHSGSVVNRAHNLSPPHQSDCCTAQGFIATASCPAIFLGMSRRWSLLHYELSCAVGRRAGPTGRRLLLPAACSGCALEPSASCRLQMPLRAYAPSTVRRWHTLAPDGRHPGPLPARARCSLEAEPEECLQYSALKPLRS